MDLKSTELVGYLRDMDSQYYGKALELRETIQAWLEYIPNTFPHYTCHTLSHSENIILQLSKLLFQEDKKPTISLSAIEAYILIAAAYLHDAGMVVSDTEKEAILREDSWRDWTTGSSVIAERLKQIEAFRDASFPSAPDSKPIPPEIRHFLADVQLRHLIAEHVRRVHHQRAAEVIRQHQGALGRFAFDDPMLQKTIADVCVAHGLPREALDDHLRFPTLRQIRGDNCNVRLMAILLRLGDLLDLSTNRACPILLSAASPLPPESYPHWTQYSRLTDFAVSPNTIVIRAECEHPEEHRVLRDWCQWIEDEIQDAPKLLASAQRHQWHPPAARMRGENPTITITPSPSATYKACDWRFELNEMAVFKRLIGDVYDSPLSFIRELIQNALDATRCQMYEELRVDGAPLPNNPTDVPAAVRERFGLRIRLFNEEVLNEQTGEKETRHSVSFDDVGTGMDQEIVTHHLLQVGCSYYTTPEFRRRYSFIPTSRFGVGFLSVFNVSSHIEIETFKASSTEPLRLTLAGPRSYVIVEKSDRKESGTSICVRLNADVKLAPGLLSRYVSSLCRRVEFPIIVDEFGHTIEIRAEEASTFVFETPDAEENGGTVGLRAFPFKDEHAQGEIYIFVRKKANGVEDWASRGWYEYTYPKLHPEVDVTSLHEGIVCFHGIMLNRTHGSGNARVRFDIRGPFFGSTLSRARAEHYGPSEETIKLFLGQLLEGHLRGPLPAVEGEGWIYLNRLADQFSDLAFWADKRQMVPAYRLGVRLLTSFNDISSESILTEITMAEPRYGLFRHAEEPPKTRAFSSATLAVVSGDFRRTLRRLYRINLPWARPVGLQTTR